MIKLGDTLTFEPKYSMHPEKYQAMVVEMQDNSLFIDYPVNLATRKTVFLLDGSQLKGSFVGKDNNVYLFDTEVLGRKLSNIPMIQLQCPGNEDYIKIQRRQYVRIEAALDVAVHPLNFDFRPFTAVTLDISAGGLCLALPRGVYIEPSTPIVIWLALDMKSGEIQYLKINSIMIRINETKAGTRNASIQFTGLTASERQYIIRYCFERQLEMKKKGL
ncbi:c-di-GMP-binding flagellar brake protein YcgR [Peribacillus deserti]|uniref:C-di-GMP-binding flagellar brake protein YcgR n=1 Tax=Peribacillus deserti TaxID=673318 RepID=A0ABS2QHP2_9BACI|nr:flagellar brake domain-containing protein [Peribacillus deserti]MBM7692664.1 c-di-GMP-binding flagellar brake protein YcgR [Peribacillus deserti]